MLFFIVKLFDKIFNFHKIEVIRKKNKVIPFLFLI